MAAVHTLTLAPHTVSNFIPFQGLGIRLRDSNSESHVYGNSTTQADVPSCAVRKDLYEETYKRQSAQLEASMAALEIFTATMRSLQLENMKF